MPHSDKSSIDATPPAKESGSDTTPQHRHGTPTVANKKHFQWMDNIKALLGPKSPDAEPPASPWSSNSQLSKSTAATLNSKGSRAGERSTPAEGELAVISPSKSRKKTDAKKVPPRTGAAEEVGSLKKSEAHRATQQKSGTAEDAGQRRSAHHEGRQRRGRSRVRKGSRPRKVSPRGHHCPGTCTSGAAPTALPCGGCGTVAYKGIALAPGSPNAFEVSDSRTLPVMCDGPGSFLGAEFERLLVARVTRATSEAVSAALAEARQQHGMQRSVDIASDTQAPMQPEAGIAMGERMKTLAISIAEQHEELRRLGAMLESELRKLGQSPLQAAIPDENLDDAGPPEQGRRASDVIASPEVLESLSGVDLARGQAKIHGQNDSMDLSASVVSLPASTSFSRQTSLASGSAVGVASCQDALVVDKSETAPQPSPSQPLVNRLFAWAPSTVHEAGASGAYTPRTTKTLPAVLMRHASSQAISPSSTLPAAVIQETMLSPRPTPRPSRPVHLAPVHLADEPSCPATPLVQSSWSRIVPPMPPTLMEMSATTPRESAPSEQVIRPDDKDTVPM